MVNRKKARLKDEKSSLALEREKRSTQGRRMTTLIGEEAEADEAFWGQDAWNVEEDEDYTTEEEKPDIFDKDFNDSEESEDESEVVVAKEKKTKKRKAGEYKEPVAKKPRAKKTAPPKKEYKGDEFPVPAPPVERKGLRASTRKKTEEAKIAEEGTKKAMAKRKRTLKKVKGRAGAEKFTQEELLKEAAQTEIESAKWLEKMKQLAEENAEQAQMKQKKNDQQFKIRYHSKRGKCNTITFRDNDAMPEILKWKGTSETAVKSQKVDVSKKLCVITGKIARYKDPLTGHPYHDLNAFKQLRQKFGRKPKHPD